MAMSRDRIRFRIGEKYYRTGQDRDRLAVVLRAVFGMTDNEMDCMMGIEKNRFGGLCNANGFSVICRPSQFARFMIYRDNVGLQNGFKDLRPELFEPESEDPYTRLAELANVESDAARRVVQTLGFDRRWIDEQLPQQRSVTVREIDISGRHS